MTKAQYAAFKKFEYDPDAGKAPEPVRTFRSDREPTEAEQLAMKLKEIENAEIKPVFDLFPTPPAAARTMVDLANIRPGQFTLEPEAGTAVLLDLLAQRSGMRPDWCEINPLARGVIESAGKYGAPVADDFLAYNPSLKYDRIVMNPPFSGRAWIKHLRHAFELLRDDGRIVALLPAVADDEVERLGGYRVETLPEGAFKEAGTMVRTAIYVIDR